MDIGKYLKEQGVRFEMHEHPAAYTAQEVAAEEHVSGDIMAKAVVVWADKCSGSGRARTSWARKAKQAMPSHRRCSLTPPSEAAAGQSATELREVL